MKKFLLLAASALVLSFSSLVAGDNAPEEKEVSTYLVGAHMSVSDASAKLKENGFDVLSTYESVENGTSIVFTSSELKKAASKEGRGFASILRVLVDDEKKVVSVDNPVYFGKAFLQDDYDHAAAVKVTESLKSAFGELTNSADKLKFDKLDGYHFMIGMPYYSDMAVVGEGDDLLAKAKEYKKGKELLFELDLGNGSTLLGYELGKKTSKFVKKIGTQNAQVLPYTILIENGKAKILAPKYYLAISYPLLSMGQFMTISTVPGAIEKDLAKPFKK
jgi:hypothetical protein